MVIRDRSVQAMRKMATDNQVYLIGGSIPEKCSSTGKLYNTSVVFDPKGEILAKHRKVHLFDIDVPGKIRYVYGPLNEERHNFLLICYR